MVQAAPLFHIAFRALGHVQSTDDFRSSWLLVLEQLNTKGPYTVEKLGSALSACFGKEDDSTPYPLLVALWELFERRLIDAEFCSDQRRAPEFCRIWITRAGKNWLAEGLRRPEVEKFLQAGGSLSALMQSREPE